MYCKTKLGYIFGFCNTSKWVFKKKYYLWISKLRSMHWKVRGHYHINTAMYGYV